VGEMRREEARRRGGRAARSREGQGGVGDRRGVRCRSGWRWCLLRCLPPCSDRRRAVACVDRALGRL